MRCDHTTYLVMPRHVLWSQHVSMSIKHALWSRDLSGEHKTCLVITRPFLWSQDMSCDRASDTTSPPERSRSQGPTFRTVFGSLFVVGRSYRTSLLIVHSQFHFHVLGQCSNFKHRSLSLSSLRDRASKLLLVPFRSLTFWLDFVFHCPFTIPLLQNSWYFWLLRLSHWGPLLNSHINYFKEYLCI